MLINERIAHASGRVDKFRALLAEEVSWQEQRGYSSPDPIFYMGKMIEYWETERDRLIDILVDDYQADLEDWSSRHYRR